MMGDMVRVEALCSINSGQYDVGAVFSLPDAEARALEAQGAVRVLSAEPEPQPLPNSKGKKKKETSWA